MNDIYFLGILVLTAVGTFFAGVYTKPLVAFYKRLFTRKKRTNKYRWGNHQLEIQQVLDLIYGRLDLLNSKDGIYLNKFDELEALIKQRDAGRTSKTKKVVLEYLKELQK